MSPCYPEDNRRAVCITCSRYQHGCPPPAVAMRKGVSGEEWSRAVRVGRFRDAEVIDATAIEWPAGQCPMYVERQIVRHYTETEPA